MRVVVCFLVGVVVTSCGCDGAYPRSYILSERSVDQRGTVLIVPQIEELQAPFFRETTEEI